MSGNEQSPATTTGDRSGGVPAPTPTIAEPTPPVEPPIPTGQGQGLAPWDDQETVPGSSQATFRRHKSDTGNAERFIDRYGANLLYVPLWRSWLVWSVREGRWRRDDVCAVDAMATDTIREIIRRATFIEDQEISKAWIKYGLQSENAGKIRAMVERARELVATTPDQFDRDAWKLNVANGTLDLRKGKLKSHHREDFITKLAPVTYDPTADCPTWLAFLYRAMQGNAEMVEFVQRAVGYSLTGDQREKCFFLIHGPTDTGKSVFVGTLHDLLSDDYGHKAATELLTIKRGGGIPNDLAAIRGKRLVTADEIGEGQRLNEPLVKKLTGGDRISARFLYGEFFSFRPECSIWIDTNHKPTISGTDDSIWNRVVPIPFVERIPRAEQDRTLSAKLRSELPGILRWAVDGCQAWQQQGLEPPTEVSSARDDYREEEDELGRFIAECCELTPEGRVRTAELHRAFCKWRGNANISNKLFTKRVREAGYKEQKSRGVLYWQGINLQYDVTTLFE
jgi:putative DNA primase/helicase